MENTNNTQPIVKNFKQKLTKKMVLIDLNQNMFNFQCNFVVQSQGVPCQAVVVTQEQLDNWKNGMVIQKAMPNLTAEEREFLITGCTQKEWDEFIGEEPE